MTQSDATTCTYIYSVVEHVHVIYISYARDCINIYRQVPGLSDLWHICSASFQSNYLEVDQIGSFQRDFPLLYTPDNNISKCVYVYKGHILHTLCDTALDE